MEREEIFIETMVLANGAGSFMDIHMMATWL